MDFDINRVYTTKDATKLKIGSKVILADDIDTLKNRVAKDKIDILCKVLNSTNKDRFVGKEGYSYNVAYFVE